MTLFTRRHEEHEDTKKRMKDYTVEVFVAFVSFVSSCENEATFAPVLRDDADAQLLSSHKRSSRMRALLTMTFAALLAPAIVSAQDPTVAAAARAMGADALNTIRYSGTGFTFGF